MNMSHVNVTILVGEVQYVTDVYTNDNGDEARDFLMEIFETTSKGNSYSNKVMCSMFGRFVDKYKISTGDTVQVLGKLKHSRIYDEKQTPHDVVTILPINIQTLDAKTEAIDDEHYYKYYSSDNH